MKISYVTIYNALDMQSWSGLGFHIGKAMEQQNLELEYIGNLKVDNDFLLLLMYIKKIIYKAIGQDFLLERESFILKQYASQVQKVIKISSDVIFSPGTIPLALIESKKPKVFYTDATFAGMIGFYECFSNLCPETIKHGNYIEQVALASSKLAIYSSDWAAQSAIRDYHISPDKVKVVPFGANIEVNRKIEDIKIIVKHRSRKTCKLLFIGIDWYRKGGKLALQIAQELNDRGVKTELHIVGLNSIPEKRIPFFLINHGFINKKEKEGREALDNLFLSCHFLILPSEADCTPVVFSEANSYGLPCLSKNVGGIPTILKDDINGKVFLLKDKAEDYANYIATYFCNWKLYEEYAYSSFNEYASRLNWDVAGKSIKKLMLEML